MSHFKIETTRLYLRQWYTSDFPEFASINANPEVMRYFPKCLSTDESNHLALRIQNLITENQWGFWAVELKENAEFIGFVGLHTQAEHFSFSPCVEIGWRINQKYWHRGLATEAAQACLLFGFKYLKLESIVAFTAMHNVPSMQLMHRLGMYYIQNFNHPDIPHSHLLSKHVLYKIRQVDF